MGKQNKKTINKINYKIDMKTPPPFQKKKDSNSLDYFIQINDEQDGPYNFDKIKFLIEFKNIDENTLMWKEGMDDWNNASKFNEFAEYFTKNNSSYNEQELNRKSTHGYKKYTSNNPKMKIISMIGIIFSITGLVVSIANWYVFTLQALNPTSTIYPDGREEITSAFLGHHEHSITLLIVLCVIFIFFLFLSIFSFVNHTKNRIS